MSPLIMVSSPELVMPAEPPKMPKVEAEPSGMAAGLGGFAQAPTVKVQVKSAAIALPGIARSFTPLAPPLILAV